MNPQHEALKKFSYQVEFAISNYQPHGLSISRFTNIVIGGLGGSGIGGRIVKSVFLKELPIPVEVVSDYDLPEYAGEKTLVILASYSGNTEETLNMFQQVLSKKCTCLVLTTGGKIDQLAREHNIQVNIMEAGFQPRMALGFSLTFLVQIFAELLGKDVREELIKAAHKLKDPKIYQDEAAQIFESIKAKLKNKLIVVTDKALEAVGLRFSQQINENAKHECFQLTLPEITHNVIESYYGQMESVFFFMDSQQNERVSSRFEFLNNLLEVEHNKVINIPIEDISLTSVYEMIHMLDWLSLYIADHRRVDSLNVPNIESLKEFLSHSA